MDRAQTAAKDSLAATVQACVSSGLTDAWHDLVRDIYRRNLDRYEEQLGDTPMALGIQCAENVKTRSLRRFRGHDAERPEDHWEIEGLDVATPANVLTFTLGRARIVTMKVPFGDGRKPKWNSKDWDKDSDTRLSIATENSYTLGYKSHFPEKIPMLFHSGSPGEVTNYMMLWAGDQQAPLTAGWLAVPILGEIPFVAYEPLWWDDSPGSDAAKRPTTDRGPRFDERPVIAPEVTPKKIRRDGQA